jgi:hypothetical protein
MIFMEFFLSGVDGDPKQQTGQRGTGENNRYFYPFISLLARVVAKLPAGMDFRAFS